MNSSALEYCHIVSELTFEFHCVNYTFDHMPDLNDLFFSVFFQIFILVVIRYSALLDTCYSYLQQLFLTGFPVADLRVVLS